MQRVACFLGEQEAGRANGGNGDTLKKGCENGNGTNRFITCSKAGIDFHPAKSGSAFHLHCHQ